MIGERLKELRDKKGLTLKQMGEILGVSHMTYQRYEKNDTDVSTDMLIKLADFYGVTTDYLLGRESPNDPLAPFNVEIIGTDDDAFLGAYKNLPDYAKIIFIDAMKKLAEAGAKEREGMTISTECGALEDSAREKDDISAG
jgi:transcriptional regulator with XRE-family HTH domain